MKKTFLLLSIFALLNYISVFAQNTAVSDPLKNLPANSINPAQILTGEYFNYEAFKIRRGANDNFTDGTPGAWFAKEGYLVSQQAVEGGIKSIDITWGRWGSANNQLLKMTVSIDGTEVGAIEHTDGNNIVDKEKQPVEHFEVNAKKNFILRIDNVSTGSNDCRFCLGPVTWVPYLFYTTKNAEVLKGDNYTNIGLVNNLDADMAAPVYTSSGTNIATVNASTGEVTGISEGVAVITATTGEITTSYTLTVLPSKPIASGSFESAEVYKRLSDTNFTNAFTTNTDGMVTYTSSNPGCAEINAATGEVSIVAVGETTITAEAPETENFARLTESYTLYVKPALWKIETFEGAQTNVGDNNATYSTEVLQSTSSVTGITWSVFLGSIRNDVGNFGNNAVALRAKKPTAAESDFDFGYLESSSIQGGIDSLTFEWNSNGSEANRTWDISILVNNTEVGKITQPGSAQIPVGGSFNRFSVNNLNTNGNFTIKIVNNSTASSDGNQFRFVLDNIEWVGYDITSGISHTASDAHFTVYPTLVQNTLHIKSRLSDYTVRVLNVAGKQLMQEHNPQSLPMETLPAGLYFVEITSGNGTKEISKIVKQ